MSSDWLEDLNHWDRLAQSFFRNLLTIVFLDASMNLTQKEKKKTIRSGKCGLATGFLLAAIHNAGLVALTHTQVQ
jgi:hypothetical protein